mgnify:CR=1 FL=1
MSWALVFELGNYRVSSRATEIQTVKLLGIPKIRLFKGATFLDKDLTMHITRTLRNAPCIVCGCDSLPSLIMIWVQIDTSRRERAFKLRMKGKHMAFIELCGAGASNVDFVC